MPVLYRNPLCPPLAFAILTGRFSQEVNGAILKHIT
jgi:hypothetical protein